MSDFISIETNPAPPGALAQTFTASDGVNIRLATIAASGAQGTVVIAPGWSEFIEKYFEVARDLQARRFNVVIIDWRGQGLSDAPQRWTGYFDRLAEDLREIREGPAAAFTGPHFLMTHSMGGLPALLLLGAGYDRFARAVLCAPLTRLFPAVANVVIGGVAGALSVCGASNMKVARGEDHSRHFDGNMFTKDPDRHARFRALQDAEPAAARSSPTYGWVREATRASNIVHRAGFLDGLKVPVQIISAGEEKRIDGADHATIAARNPLIDHVTVDGALHEIMMETDAHRDAFWRYVDAFLAPALDASSGDPLRAAPGAGPGVSR